MIELLLPEHVSCAVARHDEVAADGLFPQEEAVVRTSVPRRRREFTTVRLCARRALAGLGVPPAPVLPGPRGEPRWPAGVVGSMTHCDGFRAAAVAMDSRMRALGIDAEPHTPLPAGVFEAVTLPTERARLKLGGEVHWDRLLFSAKESVFKAWYPLTHHNLGFDEADLVFRRTPGATPQGVFSARLLVSVEAAPRSFEGRWLVRDGLVLTAIAVVTPA
ncbi:4'-phosphopantetheinyl transferase [Streptomyces sp. NBC_00893]|uniref:4'-phosphopantetheinyl transferase family protein n=1 Tax=Streptomyces sp. NBC_00893 TaxID=2975862 RepID=UPI0022525E6B|nr:4'-phosphopantetheinyl transferase superfamily protein [Streptomyces sp. NBC_00893]MCX4851556.1 4'-phosphopantetheinyl transferase superfamily protein [Streptomyces sp. NBC_00893]